MTDEQIVELTKQITGWTTHFAIPQEPHGHFYAGHHHQASVDDILRLARVLLARQPAAIDKEAAIRDRARWFVRDFSRDVGFAMSDAQAEVMLNLFLRYAAPLTNEASKPAVVHGCDIDFSGVMGIPPKHDALDVCPKCSCRRGSGSQCSNKPCPFDRASPVAPSVELNANRELVELFKEALAWGMAYGPSLVPEQWHSMSDEQANRFAARAASPAAASVAQDELGAFERALRETWQMVDPLNPPPAGTYYRGQHEGIIAALRTIRDNFSRAASPAANVAHGAEAIKSAYRQGFMAGWNGEGEAISAPPSAPPAQPALADDARDAFIRDVAAQKPEKPDHWSSCGQCGHNIERAQDLLDAAQSASASEEK